MASVLRLSKIAIEYSSSGENVAVDNGHLKIYSNSGRFVGKIVLYRCHLDIFGFLLSGEVHTISTARIEYDSSWFLIIN